MRVIKPSRVKQHAREYPDASTGLDAWLKATEAANWRNLQEVRRQFPQADAATVESKRIVTIFNIGGNKYRLIVAIHYNTQRVFVLRFLTHAEYSKNKWRDQL